MNGLEQFERTRLAKLRLAADVILDLAEEDVLPAPLEEELYVFRDRVDVALLGPGT